MTGAPCVDAVVIGAGPNGLVAANLLADAGLDVVVVEHGPVAGGSVRTAEVTAPGFRNDLFSAFYPLAGTAAAPIARLGLEHHGLRWCHAPDVVAHPRRNAPGPVLSRDLDRTLQSLAASDPAAAAGWQRLVDRWHVLGPALLPALLGGRPPVAALRDLLRPGGPGRLRSLADHARFALLPARRMVEETGCGTSGALLLGGNALHGDVLYEEPGSGILGLLLVGLGHDAGFPVPEGGAQQLTDALVARLLAHGGALRLACPVAEIWVRDGVARGVLLADGTSLAARRGVIAAVSAPALDRLTSVPWRSPGAAARFEAAPATVKVDWALSTPVPWLDPLARGAGTVHVAPTLDELRVQAQQLARGVVPARPFVIVGQMTTCDPTRSPAGTESVWAYTHLPRGSHLTPGGAARVADRMQARLEELAPGFTGTIIARHVAGPGELEAMNPSLVGGDIAGGTVQLHQQGPFRPPGSLGATVTGVARLYLGSSSVHPGGGVHGTPVRVRRTRCSAAG